MNRLFALGSLLIFVLQGRNVGGRDLQLTSDPPLPGLYCLGPVTFTCIGSADSTFRWVLDNVDVATYTFRRSDTYPYLMPPLEDIDGVRAQINSSSIITSAPLTFTVVSVMSVSNVSVFSGKDLQCMGRNIARSNTISIQVESLAPPPSPSSISCSLLPASGGAEVFLQWSPSFTSQYAVERYRVSVNPDPSSCSSEQVSPSEDYSCSGLVLGTPYTFTVSAINCGDQEGDMTNLTTKAEGPQQVSDIMVTREDKQTTVMWKELPPPESCSYGVSLDYTVIIVDNSAGTVLKETMLTSDNCSNGTCSISFSGRDSSNYRINITAANGFGKSYATSDVSCVRLTVANIALIAVGVGVLASAAVILVCIVLILKINKTGSRLKRILVLQGVLVVGPVALWIAVALQVGLHQNTCDSAWQSTRNNLIIAAHVLSDVASPVLIVVAVLWAVMQTCAPQTVDNKGCNCLCLWLAPPRKRFNPQKEGWEIALELNRGKADLKEGEGGRIAILEAPEVMVDEMWIRGETREQATIRTAEEIHTQYDAKLKEEATWELNYITVCRGNSEI